MAQSGSNSGWFFVAMAIIAIAIFSSLATVTEALGPASIPIWILVMVASVVALRGPLGKAIGMRLTGQLPAEDAVLDVPQEVYAELDELRARIGELEERTDFTERLLTKQAEGQGR